MKLYDIIKAGGVADWILAALIVGLVPALVFAGVWALTH